VILREGYVPLSIALAAAAGVVSSIGVLESLPLWVVLAWLLRVYWEHRPAIPAQPKAVLSPVQGRVIGSEVFYDPWLKRPTLRIRVAVPFPGIVPLRCPIEAKVMDLYTRVGTFGAAQRPCAVDESPDCYAQWLQTDEGEDVVFCVSSRFPVSRARFLQAPGERVGHGERNGFIYFASVVDLLIPEDSEVLVQAGQSLNAAESVLAQLPKS
jgi:phosphatidylserine decarboxylase